jgi:uridine kinase
MQELVMGIEQRLPAKPASTALLVGVSGIDGSGKGYVTAKLSERLRKRGISVAVVNVDGWLNLPHIRFDPANLAGNFYRRGIRMDEMFRRLVLPLRQERSIYLEVDHTEEMATEYRKHVYDHRDIDVILLEGIFLFKRECAGLLDLRIWIDCDFDTALRRAVTRSQEGLDPKETERAYRRIYFPAQRLHFAIDRPGESANIVYENP